MTSVRHFLLAALALWLGPMYSCLPAQNVGEASAPFHNLRSRPLEYAGPELDCSDLPEVRLGWFGPSEETNSPAGDMWWAANLAVREANAQGGCDGKPFKLLPRWSANPWGSGVAELARMLYQERPVAVLGGIDSASTHLAEQVVAKGNAVLVSPVACDKTATLAGVPWMYACAPSDAVVAAKLANAVSRELGTGSRKLALITGTDHESRMAGRELSRQLARAGCVAAFRFEVNPGTPMLEQHAKALAEAQPEAVLIAAQPPDAARLVRVVREKLPHARLYGNEQLSRASFLKLAGRDAEGLNVPLLRDPGNEVLKSEHFDKEFFVTHGRQSDYTAALTYDATVLLLEAVRKAGPHRAGIRAALAGLSPWHGIAGTIAFDGTGQNTRAEIGMGIILGETVKPVKSEPPNLDTAYK